MTVNSGTAIAAYFFAYDGNSNVTALVKAQSGTVSANYEYGPFAEPVRVTGAAAGQNRFRFSTKRTDETTDLVLYEYRAYSPSLGRWLSRDPIGQLQGVLEASRTHGRGLQRLPLTRVEWFQTIQEHFRPQSSSGQCKQCMLTAIARLMSESVYEDSLYDRNLYVYVNNSALALFDPLGLKAYVCIRPLNFPVLCKTWMFVHCFIKTDECGHWNFNDEGVGEEPNPEGVCGEQPKCVPIDCECLDERHLCHAIISSASDPAWAPATWTLTGHNCCHWVDMILKKKKCKGVAEHVPGYWLPPAKRPY